LGIDCDAQRGDRRARRRLDERRNVVKRELDRDLVEAPSQTQPNGYDDRERIERTGLRRMLQGKGQSDFR
jgi:hypothetical protein